MTRGLRKRHLLSWVIITVLLLSALIYARMNIPVFQGDLPTKSMTK